MRSTLLAACALVCALGGCARREMPGPCPALPAAQAAVGRRAGPCTHGTHCCHQAGKDGCSCFHKLGQTGDPTHSSSLEPAADAVLAGPAPGLLPGRKTIRLVGRGMCSQSEICGRAWAPHAQPPLPCALVSSLQEGTLTPGMCPPKLLHTPPPRLCSHAPGPAVRRVRAATVYAVIVHALPAATCSLIIAESEVKTDRSLRCSGGAEGWRGCLPSPGLCALHPCPRAPCPRALADRPRLPPLPLPAAATLP